MSLGVVADWRRNFAIIRTPLIVIERGGGVYRGIPRALNNPAPA